MGKVSTGCQQQKDVLKTRGVIVLGVQYMMRHGIDLPRLPKLVTRMITDDCWRERLVRQTDKIVTFKRFDDFVVTPSPDGLESKLRTLKLFCRHDPETMALLDGVMEEKLPGKEQSVRVHTTPGFRKRQESLHKKHVLFVDDEPNVLQGLRRMLRPRREQWEMTFVGSGPEALANMEKYPVDVVVSDMRMPGMDGAQFLTEVMHRYPDAARIILSGQVSQKAVHRALGSTHAYLAKPCDAQLLMATIEQPPASPGLTSLVA